MKLKIIFPYETPQKLLSAFFIIAIVYALYVTFIKEETHTKYYNVDRIEIPAQILIAMK